MKRKLLNELNKKIKQTKKGCEEMNNKEVVLRWMEGKKGSARNMSTDGVNLYSYHLLIGYTENGLKIVKDYRAKAGHFISMTTSHHVTIANRYSDKTIRI